MCRASQEKFRTKSKIKRTISVNYQKLKKCSVLANKFNIEVHAGHGMDYKTAKILKSVNLIEEFNIGHFIIEESIFYGMKKIIQNFKKYSNYMNIIGNGVDIVDNKRIEKLIINNDFKENF